MTSERLLEFEKKPGWLHWIVENYYAKLLLNKYIRPAVVNFRHLITNIFSVIFSLVLCFLGSSYCVKLYLLFATRCANRVAVTDRISDTSPADDICALPVDIT